MRLTTHGTDSGFEPFHGTRRMTNATSGRDSSTVTNGHDAVANARQDNMIEVSGTVSEACENCHSVYRDKPDLKSRCLP